MANNKKQTPASPKPNQSPEQKTGKTKQRMIYRHHRTFKGGGLVGLIILAVLVGTEAVSLKDVGLFTNQSQNEKLSTSIQVLERNYEDNNTPEQTKNTADRHAESVVARQDDSSHAQIEFHKVPLPNEETTPLTVEASHKQLRKLMKAQQNMIRMLNQKLEKQQQTYQQQIENLSLQVVNALTAEQPTLFKINEAQNNMQLRQDTLFFYNQWQQGFIAEDELIQWLAYMQAQGLPEATKIAEDLTNSLQSFGIMNKHNLRQTVRTLYNKHQQTPSELPKEAPEASPQAPQEATKAQDLKWWQKLKERFSELVVVRRVEQNQPETTGQQDVYTQLKQALEQDHMADFWQVLLENRNIEHDAGIQQLRRLVDVHFTQMNGFRQLYRSLRTSQSANTDTQE